MIASAFSVLAVLPFILLCYYFFFTVSVFVTTSLDSISIPEKSYSYKKHRLLILCFNLICPNPKY